ncbi:MAG TPA: GH25 family lysozyme [Bryobacteraceae bacterium]|nr:GH25 family lysozyme [Bryobacteraceae bacterium]
MNNLNAPGARFLSGIDVSSYQRTVDWTAVAGSGIQFCYIKATEGSSCADHGFAQHWRRAGETGLARGAYHFFHPTMPVTTQANFFLHTVGEPQPGDLPPALDLEAPEEWVGIPAAARAALAIKWLEIVETRLNLAPIVYLSPAFMIETLRNASALGRYRLWLAEYTSAAAPRVPSPWTAWTFWQHMGKGRVPGVALPVDLNWFNGTAGDLQALAVAAPQISPVPPVVAS